MARIDKIIKDVKVILDENENIGNGFLDVASTGMPDPDQLQTDELIRKLIPIAVDKIHKLASEDLLDESVINSGGDITWQDNEYGCSVASLPSDFLRVLYVKLDTWKRGTTKVLDESDPLVAEYFSKYAGVRPTSVYPSVAIFMGDKGMSLIACPKGNGGACVVRYVKTSVADGSGDGSGDGAGNGLTDIAIANKCYYAVLYYIACLYYTSINEKQRADMMAAEAAEMIGITAQNIAAS